MTASSSRREPSRRQSRRNAVNIFLAFSFFTVGVTFQSVFSLWHTLEQTACLYSHPGLVRTSSTTSQQADTTTVQSTSDTAAVKKPSPTDVQPSETTTTNKKDEVVDGASLGIFSEKPTEFFRELQKKIDDDDNDTRCRRYGFTYNRDNPKNRRLFLGTLIADEPWELVEILAAEAYGLYSGMVLVEGNRTQNFNPRRFKRLHHTDMIQERFHAEQVQVRPYVNEDPNITGLPREHHQRTEIINGWKELGMGPNDVGILSDFDEMFSRDFLWAAKVCDSIDAFDYEKHKCHHKSVKIQAVGRNFEGSPECIMKEYTNWHPDMILGACIEQIGDESLNPKAPRSANMIDRAKGWDCKNREEEILKSGGAGALWNAADFRRLCGGKQVPVDTKAFPNLSKFNSFHFHNFFSHANAIRFKYRTYGHSTKKAHIKSLSQISNALAMLYSCVKEETAPPGLKWHAVEGGFEALQPMAPIYFADAEYRKQRHEFVQQIVEADEKELAEQQKQTQ